ncbi:hypothetical protein K491DRAFT_699009 [Lophiostoma macrostomum CBS 122681]|uniref:Uncharacterized protein n=1 Tax=Lophiostoma macrostomum CBS 122681 TaxID=1314788 RepID=A0A6A6SKB1_9PLEO|nr:hypothetical protein K491DRAFT_699009 [Lophiostoma macrostomum CBS 122681]
MSLEPEIPLWEPQALEATPFLLTPHPGNPSSIYNTLSSMNTTQNPATMATNTNQDALCKPHKIVPRPEADTESSRSLEAFCNVYLHFLTRFRYTLPRLVCFSPQLGMSREARPDADETAAQSFTDEVKESWAQARAAYTELNEKTKYCPAVEYLGGSPEKELDEIRTRGNFSGGGKHHARADEVTLSLASAQKACSGSAPAVPIKGVTGKDRRNEYWGAHSYRGALAWCTNWWRDDGRRRSEG